nr:protein FAR1-RELATED SEQUENCE 5-like [Aegilops tauschii subsp. strangulata]
MASQRKISEFQAFEIEAADDSGIRPQAAYELATRQVGGRLNLGYTPHDHRNHLQSNMQRELAFGQAGSMLKYFQDKIVENPSFQYALQLDCQEDITNIFWADAKMMVDYAHFGDVVTFDTTFGTNKEYRPFGVFLGLNQFRETTVFGAALMFDETFASFQWLFNTFLVAHNGRQPRTIYTDQDIAMGKAVKDVFTEAYHGLCTFHIMQNAVKHLSPVKGEEKDEAEEKDEGEEKDEDEEPHILTDFSACMYGYEDPAAFEEAFVNMRCRMHKQTWFDSIYKLEEKLNASTSDMNEPSKAQENDDPNMQQGDDLLRAARLKKKEVQSKNSKRKNSWLDKLHKGKRKATKPPASTKNGAKQKKKKDDVQPKVDVENDGSKRSPNAENAKLESVSASLLSFLSLCLS